MCSSRPDVRTGRTVSSSTATPPTPARRDRQKDAVLASVPPHVLQHTGIVRLIHLGSTAAWAWPESVLSGGGRGPALWPKYIPGETACCPSERGERPTRSIPANLVQWGNNRGSGGQCRLATQIHRREMRRRRPPGLPCYQVDLSPDVAPVGRRRAARADVANIGWTRCGPSTCWAVGRAFAATSTSTPADRSSRQNGVEAPGRPKGLTPSELEHPTPAGKRTAAASDGSVNASPASSSSLPSTSAVSRRRHPQLSGSLPVRAAWPVITLVTWRPQDQAM
jgi:hypothetical protein